MKSSVTYKIYPIYLGELYRHEKSFFTYMNNTGVITVCPFIAFLLLGTNGKKILVDTGGSDEAWGNKYHMAYKRPEGCDILSKLRKDFWLGPEDIDYIINTHLHWDHAWGDHLFPGKGIYVQKKEVEFADNPLPTQYKTYEAPEVGLTANWKKVRNQLIEVDGDTVIDDGIELILLPGHTDGIQGVLVNTTDGEYLLASDCINLYENWEKQIIAGIHSDLRAYFDTYKKIKSLEIERKIKIIPGHDMKVLEQKMFPIE